MGIGKSLSSFAGAGEMQECHPDLRQIDGDQEGDLAEFLRQSVDGTGNVAISHQRVFADYQNVIRSLECSRGNRYANAPNTLMARHQTDVTQFGGAVRLVYQKPTLPG